MTNYLRIILGLLVSLGILLKGTAIAAPVDLTSWQLSGTAALTGNEVLLTQAVNNQYGRVAAPVGFCASEFRMTFDINVGTIISSSGGTGVGLVFLNSNGQIQFRAHADTLFNNNEDQRYELNENHISIESLGAPSDLFGVPPPAGTMAFGPLAASVMPFRMEGAGWFKGEIHKRGSELTVQFLDGTRGLVLRSNVLYLPGEVLVPAFEGLTTTARNEHRIRNVDLQVIERSGCTIDPVPLTREDTSALILSVCGDTTACPDRATHLSCVDSELGQLLNEGQISQETADIVRLESERGLSYCDGYNQCLVDIDPDAIRSAAYDEGFMAGVESIPVDEIRQQAFNEGRTQGDAEGHSRGLAEGQSIGYSSGYSEGLATGDAAGYSRGFTEGRTSGYAEGEAAGDAAGYTRGFSAGQIEGRAQGHTEGYAAGEAAGRAAGDAAGYARGFTEGETAGDAAGYARGFSAGQVEGRAQGYTEGYAAGEAAGRAAGDAAGYARGFAEGEVQGTAAGYAQGYSAGETSGQAAGYTQGFTAGDSAGYSRGINDGTEAGYSQGLTAGRAEGYSAGFADGEEAGRAAGFQQGLDEGYASGFEAGDSSGYTRGFSEGQTSGFESGYQDGYETGHSEGHTAGYDSGYQEGFNSAEQICERGEAKDRISLDPQCSPNPDRTRVWSVSNPFKFPILVTWSLDKSDQRGFLFLRPRSEGTFETRTQKGDNTARVYILGKQAAVKSSNGKKCNR